MKKAETVKEQFKMYFEKGSTKVAVDEMRAEREDWSKAMNHLIELVSISGGGYVVVNENDRLDSWCDTYYYDGNHPKRKDVLDLFKLIVESGETHFQIVWQTTIRYWDTHLEKFDSDCYAEPTGDGTNTTLLSTY